MTPPPEQTRVRFPLPGQNNDHLRHGNLHPGSPSIWANRIGRKCPGAGEVCFDRLEIDATTYREQAAMIGSR